MTTVHANAANSLEMPEISASSATHPPTWKAPDSVMVQLRRETRAAHERIEQVTRLQRLWADDYTLDEYYQLLKCWYGFYNPFEEKLFSDGLRHVQHLPNRAMLKNRRKCAWLEADLTYLSKTTALLNEENAWNDCPRCEALPEITDLHHTLGAFYVLEGATLGGQIIRRRLIAHFGTAITESLHFYSSYGDNIGAQWRAFGDLMRDYQMAGLLQPTDEVIAAANHTFQALTQWLET